MGRKPRAQALTSHRQIVRSTAVIALASISTVLIGLVRTKAIALLVGPVGLGLISVYLNLVNAASAIAGLGLNASAVREIAGAEAAADQARLAATRRALLLTTGAAATVTAGAMIHLHGWIGTWLPNGFNQPEATLWLALAVFLTVLSVNCVILLNGYRRIGDMAKTQVGGALAGTIAGIGALAIWRLDGTLAYVVAAPAAALVVGLAYAARLPRPTAKISDVRLILNRGLSLVAHGTPFMLSVFALSASVLLVRAITADNLGGEALGHFAATWIISSTYVGYVLQAMGADYFPRLSEAVDDRTQTARLVNEQLETAVILATPILLLTLATAPWLLHLAYSGSFREAADLLRWQILGDLFKILAWPLSMLLLAKRRSVTYFLIEATAAATFAGFVYLSIDRLGLLSAGIGYAGMYLLYWLAQLACARIPANGHMLRSLGLSAAAIGVTFLISIRSDFLGLLIGLAGTAATSLLALKRLNDVGALPSAVQRTLPWLGKGTAS